MNVEPTQGSRVLLEFRFYFHNNHVFVGSGIDGRNLPCAVSIVQRIFNLLGSDAERRCLVTINVNVQLRVVNLNVAGDVEQTRQRTHLFQKFIGTRVELVSIWPLQRQLIGTLGNLATYLNQRWILQVNANARDARQTRAQIVDNRLDILLSLIDWLQQHQDVAGVAGSANVALT